MKATKTSREAADLVDVRRNGEGGVTYTCLKCGFAIQMNAYYEADYKRMLGHVASCDGQRIPPGPNVQAQTKDIQLYGGGKALKHMAWRVKNCVPNGNRLQDHEAMSLAQISLATGLNPFTGEVWYIPGKGPMAGIRGLRRRAREQSTYSLDSRAMKPDEAQEHRVGTEDVGCICELYRHDVLQRAVEINRAAGSAVIPIKPIMGVGIWRKGDQIPAGKSPTWVAEKRAEADALRKGFDLTELPYTDETNGIQFEVADAEDADWSVVSDEVMRREAAHNAARYDEPSTQAAPLSFEGVIAAYKDGQRELPPWAEEIREAIKRDPKASDPVSKGMIQQLSLSAQRKVTEAQFRAFIEIILGNPMEDLTFGGSRVLMNTINGDDFEVQVVSLLS